MENFPQAQTCVSPKAFEQKLAVILETTPKNKIIYIYIYIYIYMCCISYWSAMYSHFSLNTVYIYI